MSAMHDTAHFDLAPTLQRLRSAWQAQRPDYAQRRADLLRLRNALVERQEQMLAAIDADYGNRSRHETLLGDVMPVLAEIDHLRTHLRRWMLRVQKTKNMKNKASKILLIMPLSEFDQALQG